MIHIRGKWRFLSSLSFITNLLDMYCVRHLTAQRQRSKIGISRGSLSNKGKLAQVKYLQCSTSTMLGTFILVYNQKIIQLGMPEFRVERGGKEYHIEVKMPT